MNMTERFRELFEYELDAHDKVIASYDTVTAERRSDAAFQKAVDLFAHIVGARALWLFRLGVIPSGPEVFPQNSELDDLVARAAAVNQAWMNYLDRIDDRELSRVFEYTSLDGRRFKNSIEEILTQLFGHSWYHRGQIAALIKILGGVPAMTDYVFWSRQSVD